MNRRSADANRIGDSGLLRVTRAHGGALTLTIATAARPGDSAEQLARDIIACCEDLITDLSPPSSMSVVSGHDGFAMRAPTGGEEADAQPTWTRAAAAIRSLPFPTIAAIASDAIGPGWELALACDLRLLADDARVGSPEVRWGRIPSAGGTQRLRQVVGEATALRLLLLGELVDARSAFDLGLVNWICPASELGARLAALVDIIGASAPIAAAYAKETVRAAAETPLATGLRIEADLATLLQTTHDRAEGIASFGAKRKPRFEGR